jgi:hypothetical protein
MERSRGRSARVASACILLASESSQRVPTYLTQSVQNNASLYLDAFITQSGKSPVRGDPTYPGDGDVLHVRKPLTRYQTQRKVRAVKNLLTGKSDKEKAEAEAAQQAEDEKEETEEEWKARPIVSFYHPNVTLDLVVDSGAIELAKTPPPVRSRKSSSLVAQSPGFQS